MSLDFALKDLYHFGGSTKAFLKSSVAVIAIPILFLNLAQSLGIFNYSTPVTQFTLTFLDILSQFHVFIVVLSFVLAVAVIITLNHALISHRKNDIAVMQS